MVFWGIQHHIGTGEIIIFALQMRQYHWLIFSAWFMWSDERVIEFCYVLIYPIQATKAINVVKKHTDIFCTWAFKKEMTAVVNTIISNIFHENKCCNVRKRITEKELPYYGCFSYPNILGSTDHVTPHTNLQQFWFACRALFSSTLVDSSEDKDKSRRGLCFLTIVTFKWRDENQMFNSTKHIIEVIFLNKVPHPNVVILLEYHSSLYLAHSSWPSWAIPVRRMVLIWNKYRL